MSEALKQAAQKLLAHVEDKGEGRRSTCLPFDVEALRAALSQPAPAPQPAAPVVSDEQIKETIDCIDWSQMVTADDYMYMIARAILALRPAVEPMTPEQIIHIADTRVGRPTTTYPLGCTDWINFARAVEAHHGITAKAEDAHQPTKEAEKP